MAHEPAHALLTLLSNATIKPTTSGRIDVIVEAHECAAGELRKSRPGNARTLMLHALRLLDSTWPPSPGKRR